MFDTEQLWQFPYGWPAIDDCHLPLNALLEVWKLAKSITT